LPRYSRLIHTVDHVEGFLRPEFDALDAFLCHAWAVTVTGAPKAWAMQFVEDQEKSPRAWYAGAVGHLSFDKNMNTGLTLRTIRIHRGVASVRAGATLLWDSVPEAEEAETRLKASAFLDALRQPRGTTPAAAAGLATPLPPCTTSATRILLIDHEDSFVHTLGNYLRQTGAEVVTQRAGFDPALLDALRPALVVLSPGPGSPTDFQLSKYIAACMERRLPIFGVCLGLQGMVEHFGGRLNVLDQPMHGKPSIVTVHRPSYLFTNLPDTFQAARYHSLHAERATFPGDKFTITASTADGCVMAIEHQAYV
jgi:anthranilate synthase